VWIALSRQRDEQPSPLPRARAWADSRVRRIYAGTNEFKKELISRSL